MQLNDSQMDLCTYQAIPVYAAASAHGLLPAAPIYEANSQDCLNQSLTCDDISTAYFNMPRQGSMQMKSTFTSAYPHHPSNSVSMSAIQPFESCLSPSTVMYPGPTDYSQYFMASPETTAAPGNGTSCISGQSTVSNSAWTNTVMPISLDYPYDIQGLYANSDGTISNVWSSTVTPPMHQNACLSTKRSSDAMLQQSMDPQGTNGREKRQCLGMRVRRLPLGVTPF